MQSTSSASMMFLRISPSPDWVDDSATVGDDEAAPAAEGQVADEVPNLGPRLGLPSGGAPSRPRRSSRRRCRIYRRLRLRHILCHLYVVQSYTMSPGTCVNVWSLLTKTAPSDRAVDAIQRS